MYNVQHCKMSFKKYMPLAILSDNLCIISESLYTHCHPFKVIVHEPPPTELTVHTLSSPLK